MTVVEITRTNISQIIADNQCVIIDFWGPACPACTSFGSIFIDFSKSHKDICFAAVNTATEQELAEIFAIRAVPTLVIYKNQIKVLTLPGALPIPGLSALIKQLRELDTEQFVKDNQQ